MELALRLLALFLLFSSLPLSRALLAQSRHAPSLTAAGDSPFHLELTQPQYSKEGIATSSGGVIWSDHFRLQAEQMRHYTREGDSWIEASGNLSLFYQGYLLVGRRVIYNLTQRQGILYGAATGAGGWYLCSPQLLLTPSKMLYLATAELSTDPAIDSHWSLEARTLVIEPRGELHARHLTFRLFHLPLFFIPRLSSSRDSLLGQPIQYDIGWKGQRERRISLRYRFYQSEQSDLWARLEYHIARGLGIGFEGSFKGNRRRFETSNFIAKDSSLVSPGETRSYRLKGYYQHHLGPHTQLEFFYDRYSDSDIPSDYSFTRFDRHQPGQTKVILRDAREHFIQQLGWRTKVNPFQSVKKELPSYWFTPHPLRWSPPSLGILIQSHWRAEYLSYDFQQQLPHADYHALRLSAQAALSRTFQLSRLQITPQLGTQLRAYNATPHAQSAAMTVPSANLYLQTQWLHEGSINHHVTLYSSWETVARARYRLDEHYLFDHRDALVGLTLWRSGLRQRWFDPRQERAHLQLEWIHLWDGCAQDIAHLEGSWLFTPYTRFSGKLQLSRRGADSFSLRHEATPSTQLAFSWEYRQRQAGAWRKNDPSSYVLERVRPFEQLLHSDLNQPRRSFLTSIHFHLSPNWKLRFDMAHGWSRRQGDQPLRGYQQYCAGLGTDLGAGWQLKLQLSRNPHQWDWRVRLDLSDSPVTAPSPRF